MPTTDSEFLPIDVEQTDWERARVHLAAIAREIFTGEPARLTKSDLQRNDPDALYWLAYGTGRVPMGAARLQNGRLATVAVVPGFVATTSARRCSAMSSATRLRAASTYSQ